MAVYDYNYDNLQTFLSGTQGSDGTKGAILNALTSASLLNPDSIGGGRDAIPIEVVTPTGGLSTTDTLAGGIAFPEGPLTPTNVFRTVDYYQNPISLFLAGGANQVPGASPTNPVVEHITPGVTGVVIATSGGDVKAVDMGNGGDTLFAGNNGTVAATNGYNTLRGGLMAGTSSTLIGGAGHDRLSLGAGDGKMVGGGSTSFDTIFAGSGQSTVRLSAGHATVHGALTGGFSTINILGGVNVFSQTVGGGADRINITPSSATSDTITGGGAALTTVILSVANAGAAVTQHTTGAHAGYTEIKFGSGASAVDLEVKNLTVHFTDGNKTY